MQSDVIETGAVKWFDVPKSYGFITPDFGGRDLFFHTTEVVGGAVLGQGQKVRYKMGTDPKGRSMAVDVEAVKPAPVRP